MYAFGRAGRIERLTIQPPGQPMNAIAEAIADRQSEIERLQAEIHSSRTETSGASSRDRPCPGAFQGFADPAERTPSGGT